MALRELDSEHADRDLTSQVIVLTDTPDAGKAIWCQVLVALGDGAKDLDGSGGDFELVVTVGGQTVQPAPQTIAFSTAPRVAIWSAAFCVPAGDEVVIKILSPNVADNDVDVTAYLYDTHGEDLYEAEISLRRDADTGSGQDEYDVHWLKNGERITDNNATTVQVIKRSDATDLVAATGMTHVLNGWHKYDEATNRMTLGETYEVVVVATIDGTSRTCSKLVGRDV